MPLKCVGLLYMQKQVPQWGHLGITVKLRKIYLIFLAYLDYLITKEDTSRKMIGFLFLQEKVP
jgi:hypothetical protein